MTHEPTARAAARSRTASRGWLLPAAVLILLLAATVVLSRMTARLEHARTEQRFTELALDRVEGVVERVETIQEDLLSIGAFYEASRSVERSEFHLFCRGILERHGEILAISWTPRVRSAEREAFEAAVRQEGLRDFRMMELGRGPGPTPAGVAAERYPILFREPDTRPQDLGLDLFTDPVLRAGMADALEREEPVLTAPASIPPVFGPDTVLRFAIPVFSHTAPPRGAPGRAEGIEGFVVFVVAADRFIEESIRHLTPMGIHFEIDDVTGSPDGVPVARHRSRLTDSTAPVAKGALARQDEFEVAGRRWRLRSVAAPQFEAGHEPWGPWIVLISGIVVALVVSGSVRRATGRALEVQRLVELRTAELSRLTAILDATPDFVGIAGVDGRRIYLNPAGCRMLGLDPGDPRPGTSIATVYPAWAYDVVSKQAIPAAIRDGSWTGETALLHPDGHEIPVSQVLLSHRGPDGQVSYLSTVMRDIRERKAAEAALRRSEQRLQDILDNSPSLVVVRDREGRYLVVNRAYERIVGKTRAEIIGRTLHEVLPRAEERWAAQDRRALEASAPVESEEAIPLPDGRRGTFLMIRFPLRDPGGSAYAVCGIATDITDRKRIEAETIADYNRRLETAVRDLRRTQEMVDTQARLQALGEMASGIAHDFNNALAPVLGFAELLLADPRIFDAREKALGHVRAIQTSAQDAASVVRRLRAFSRQQREGEPLVPVDLNAVIRETIALTEPRWKDQSLAAGKRIEVRHAFGAVSRVLGSEAELREALTNLIFNAVDAMPAGGTITIATVPDGDAVMLVVSDTGTGMTEEVRRRCLEPFFTTKGEAGTGMGLAMVYGILRRHEGTIDIESAPGAGTAIRLRFPAAPAATPERGEKPMAERTPVPRRGNVRILVVDDEPMIREVLRSYLELDGHAVETACDGRDGLEKFQAGQWDLVLTDSAMPNLNGDELAALVKAARPELPVIQLTGFGGPVGDGGTGTAHIDVVLGKPVSIEELRAAVQRCVGG